jgi:hypothetical protein
MMDIEESTKYWKECTVDCWSYCRVPRQNGSCNSVSYWIWEQATVPWSNATVRCCPMWPYWYNSVQLRYFTALLTVRRIVVSRGKMVHAIEWVAVLPLALLDLGTGEIFVTAVVVSTLLSHVTILVQQRTHKHWRQKYFTCTQAVWWQWQYLHSINCMNDFDARHDNTTNSQQCREVTQLLRYTLFNTSYSHRFQWRQRV